MPLMSSLFSRMEQELRLLKLTEILPADISFLSDGEQVVFLKDSLFERYSRKRPKKKVTSGNK